MNKIAAILTCHNRKDKTINCLEKLFTYVPNIEVFLTDDGSTDGTGEQVKTRFPSVHVIYGDGNLFWCRGMYVAWSEAIKYDYDYYLLLNDDTLLYSFFLDEMLECERIGGQNCIITGILESIDKMTILYGGRNRNKKRIVPNGRIQEVYIMNGNVVLVPNSVVEAIGIFDSYLHHDLGDHDYGFTAIEHGISVYTTRRPVGTGDPNNIKRMRKWGVSLFERFRSLSTPLASPPKLNFYFHKKHFGVINAICYVSKQYILNILPDIIVKIIAPNYK